MARFDASGCHVLIMRGGDPKVIPMERNNGAALPRAYGALSILVSRSGNYALLTRA
jgi:hypothetical protein